MFFLFCLNSNSVVWASRQKISVCVFDRRTSYTIPNEIIKQITIWICVIVHLHSIVRFLLEFSSLFSFTFISYKKKEEEISEIASKSLSKQEKWYTR